jgi:hypothetical protein
VFSIRAQASDDLVSLGDLVFNLMMAGRRLGEDLENLLQALSSCL